MPMKGAYKVYILDEAHMLTTEARNAFLKTLEEPPGSQHLYPRHHGVAEDSLYDHVEVPALRFPEDS